MGIPLKLNTHTQTIVKLQDTDGIFLSNVTLYCQLVGSLIYFTVNRPDISYMVYLLSHFMDATRSSHNVVVFRATSKAHVTVLHFSPQSSLDLWVYFNGGWVGNPVDH